MVADDREALAGLVAEDAVYVHSTAVAESRDEYFEGLDQGLYEYEAVSSRDVRVRIYGDSALTDGICDMRVGAHGGAAVLIHLMYVLAWVRRGGRWRLVHRHATRMR
jgi:ketosteroid isomerase-like protein